MSKRCLLYVQWHKRFFCKVLIFQQKNYKTWNSRTSKILQVLFKWQRLSSQCNLLYKQEFLFTCVHKSRGKRHRELNWNELSLLWQQITYPTTLFDCCPVVTIKTRFFVNRKSNIKRIACNVKLAKILSKVTTRRSLSGCQRNLVKIQEFIHLSFVFHEATMLAPDAIAPTHIECVRAILLIFSQDKEKAFA